MAAEVKQDVALEIAHVLFIDIVAYSKMASDDQRTAILADVFAIQSEIAKAIADQLQAKLSPNEKSAIEQRPTNDVVAFDLYSRAKTLIVTTTFSAMGRENMLQAIDLLNQALARDPSFFLAQCQLAYAHDRIGRT